MDNSEVSGQDSYIICRILCKMKMQGPLFKNIYNIKLYIYIYLNFITYILISGGKIAEH